MKFLPIAIALILLPFPAMAQNSSPLPGQVYVDRINEITLKTHPDSPYLNGKTNTEKLEDGKMACLWMKSHSAKSYIKSKIYEAFERFPGDSQEKDFFYLVDYHQEVLANAIYVFCPQHLEEYAAVNDRISQEGLEWIVFD